MIVSKPKTAYRATLDNEWAPLVEQIEALGDGADVEDFYTHFLLTRAPTLPAEWASNVRDACDARIGELAVSEAHRGMDAIVGNIARFG